MAVQQSQAKAHFASLLRLPNGCSSNIITTFPTFSHRISSAHAFQDSFCNLLSLDMRLSSVERQRVMQRAKPANNTPLSSAVDASSRSSQET